ncbi:MAG TPA: DUF4097 family beta strand repeat-containing protein [Thermoanaerobaculia bacterium]|nr:DUF4097 family beta strand repeat-containing protein [Thermoanaerobaculia bacterium]
MKTHRILVATTLALFTAASLLAKNVVKTEKFVRSLTLAPGGSFVIENAIGDIEIIGVDGSGVEASIVKTITGLDEAAATEGQERVHVQAGGDERVRVLRTLIPATAHPRWGHNVSFQLRIPRTVHVRVGSELSNRIRVSNISGNVLVKNFNGLITLDAVTGATRVESVNGSIVFDSPQPVANVELSTVNGDVQVVVAPNANFRWVGETLKGDLRTTLPVRGRIDGNTFAGNVNAPGGPTVSTGSLTGKVYLLRRGSSLQQAQSIQSIPAIAVSAKGPAAIGPAASGSVQQQLVQGRFIYTINIGNVYVGEVRGDATVTTGAGEVQLGTVFGKCNVNSNGGPLHLGEMYGPLVARTRAGDILVDAAREGGLITTEGGIIRLLYTGGPTTLQSGGGDIVVRQAAAPVSAETHSGDIAITVDPSAKTMKLDAKTAKGNITISVPPRFSADIDATVMTSDPTANMIRSDFAGLSIKREQVGGRTRVRATGKVNGGGEKLTLYAEDGGIQILAPTTAPITVVK